MSKKPAQKPPPPYGSKEWVARFKKAHPGWTLETKRVRAKLVAKAPKSFPHARYVITAGTPECPAVRPLGQPAKVVK